VYKTGRTEECSYVKGANTAVQMIVTRNISHNNATLLLKRLFRERENLFIGFKDGYFLSRVLFRGRSQV